MCRRALDLKTEHTPASLYRYRKPTSLDEIRSNTIWLSAPSKFNDPFDSAVSIDLAPAMQASLAGADARSKFASADPARLAAFVQAEDKLASLDELFAAAAAKRNGEEKRPRFSTLFRQFLDEQSAGLTNVFSQGWQRRLKVASFTEVSDSLVLWSHYAQNHEGFRIEYNFSALGTSDPARQALFPVIYSPQRLDLGEQLASVKRGGPQNPMNIALAAIHKSPDWSYEREWRLVQVGHECDEGIQVSMFAPSSVLVGARATSQLRDEICRLAAMNGFSVHQMDLSPRQFRLESRKIIG